MGSWRNLVNIIIDIESARTVFSHLDFPLEVVDYNQGVDVLTGSGLIGQEDNPVYKMYKVHGKGRECSSWDPIAFLYACGLYEDCFELSEFGKVIIEEKGLTNFMEKDGKHRLVYLKPEKKEKVKNIINDLFRRSMDI